MPISVLYIHHSGMFGGSSRSLLELIQAFPDKTVIPYLITPHGNVPDVFQNENILTMRTLGIAQMDNTKYGFYRGYRWLVLLREFFYICPTLFALLRARLKWKKIDVVHINEVTMILSIILAKWIFRKPIIVHVRSVQQTQKTRWRTWLVTSILHYFADVIIAIDDTVARSLPTDLPIQVIHNGFSLEKKTKSTDTLPFASLNISANSLKIAMIGTLHPMKGVYEFVEAAKLCKERNIKAYFFIIGSNIRALHGFREFILKKLQFAHNVGNDLRDSVQQHGLESYVHFIDFTLNIQEIYENIDLLCFPSHLNAVGRPVFEAAFSKVPSIVAIHDPLADTIVDGETGVCIAPKNATALADAIEYFYRKPEEIRRMGDLAYKLALKNFDIRVNAQKVLGLYESVQPCVK